jgi:hypothetical protein
MTLEPEWIEDGSDEQLASMRDEKGLVYLRGTATLDSVSTLKVAKLHISHRTKYERKFFVWSDAGAIEITIETDGDISEGSGGLASVISFNGVFFSTGLNP